MLRAFSIVSSFTLFSRILGFIRDVLIASSLGASIQTDIFLAAFRFVNLFRGIFAEGALHAAFIPLYQKIQYQSPENLSLFQQAVFTILLGSLLIFIGILFIFSSTILQFYVPGFEDLDRTHTRVLLHTLLPYIVFISLIGYFSALLNIYNDYKSGALCPIFFNGSLIVIFFMVPDPKNNLIYITWGMSLSTFLQTLFLIIIVKRKQLVIKILTEPFKILYIPIFLRNFFPILLAAGITQIGVFIDTAIASLSAEGSLSYIYYAERLKLFPIGIIGVSLSITLLPVLSKLFIEPQNHAQALQKQNEAISLAFSLCFPASIGLYYLAHPIIALLFENGSFTSYDTEQSAGVLRYYVFGIPAIILIKIFTANFFAQGKTKIPLYLIFFTVGINIVLNFLLIAPFAHNGIAIASSITLNLYAFLCWMILYRKKYFIFYKKDVSLWLKLIVLNTLLAGIVNVFLKINMPVLLIMIFVCLIYGFLLLFTKIFTINQIKKILSKDK